MNNKKLVFSGVQPTGNLHLGNYLGALKNFASLQKDLFKVVFKILRFVFVSLIKVIFIYYSF